MSFSNPAQGRASAASEGFFPDDSYIHYYVYSGSITYHCRAKPGTATSAALWQIARELYDSSGKPTSILYADGDLKFDNICDNAASLSYS